VEDKNHLFHLPAVESASQQCYLHVTAASWSETEQPHQETAQRIWTLLHCTAILPLRSTALGKRHGTNYLRTPVTCPPTLQFPSTRSIRNYVRGYWAWPAQMVQNRNSFQLSSSYSNSWLIEEPLTQQNGGRIPPASH